MKNLSNIQIFYKDIFAGFAGLSSRTGGAIFIYSDQWLKEGFDISPFAMPLSEKNRIFVTKNTHPTGMFGVFTESLPGRWGEYLHKKFLGQMGIDYNSMNMLDKLVLVGSKGCGALKYKPETMVDAEVENLSLDDMYREISALSSSGTSDAIGTLYMKGGNTGGSVPKIIEEIDGQPWIIKIPVRPEDYEKGLMEYEYMSCAKKCGINVPEIKLIETPEGNCCFGIKRFDRLKAEDGSLMEQHIISAAAVLEKDWRDPGNDYHDLMKVALAITKDNRADIEDLFRRMCFNVFAANNNDNLKKFAFMYCEKEKGWRLAPAYGLRASTASKGARMLTVNGNGMIPTAEDLAAAGGRVGINKADCSRIIEEVETIVKENLKKYV
ncbi:MAG: type II toxin-antitoxin system HipA family toxin [Firmicutes bacterium]|nr:type II toxin-antitoxin system HipA family toxin [Bacillota bacterium]